MLSTVLLSILMSVGSTMILNEDMDRDIIVNGVHHYMEPLIGDIDRPYLLSVEEDTADLFFSFSTTDAEEQEIYRSAKLNLYTKEFVEISGVTEGFATAVDPETHEVYIGGSDGIYKFDKETNEAKMLAVKGTNIWELFFQKVLYFVTFQRLYTYDKKGNVKRVRDLESSRVHHFVIDPENTVFFTNETGLFTVQLGLGNVHLFREFPEVGARALAIDKKGLAHICLQDGVYSINKMTGSLKKLVHIDDAFGLAFDANNNIIYSYVDGIIRLKKNTTVINDSN